MANYNQQIQDAYQAQKDPLTGPRQRGTMRPPLSPTVTDIGQGLKKYSPALGGALEKAGVGMQLEPKDYGNAMLESTAYIPAAKGVSMVQQVGRPMARGARAYNRAYMNPLGEAAEEIKNTQNARADFQLFRKNVTDNTAKDIRQPLDIHDAAVNQARQNSDADWVFQNIINQQKHAAKNGQPIRPYKEIDSAEYSARALEPKRRRAAETFENQRLSNYKKLLSERANSAPLHGMYEERLNLNEDARNQQRQIEQRNARLAQLITGNQ